jgi:hypothetical protein
LRGQTRLRKVKMTQNSNILQELIELESTLANLAPQNVYEVPDGYFEGLANLVLNRIKALETNSIPEELGYLSPVLGSLSKQMPYSIPAGYFEGLEDRLMQGVLESGGYLQKLQTAKEELESISPFLNGLNKQMPYSIPQGYFENLSPNQEDIRESIPARIVPLTGAKVVSMTPRKWFRFAAAAMITGIIALAAFLYFNNQSKTDPAKSFAKFEKKLDKEIKKTSDTELTEFVQQFTIAGLNGEEKVYNDPKTEPKEFLKDVPESELKEFLQETADPDLDDDVSLMN